MVINKQSKTDKIGDLPTKSIIICSNRSTYALKSYYWPIKSTSNC